MLGILLEFSSFFCVHSGVLVEIGFLFEIDYLLAFLLMALLFPKLIGDRMKEPKNKVETSEMSLGS